METNLIRQVNRNAFYVLCLFPILPLHWISIVSIVLLTSGLAVVFTSKKQAFDWQFFFLMASLVIIFIPVMPFTEYVNQALRSMSVKLVLLVLGVHFGFDTLKPSPSQIDKGFGLFSLAAVAIVFWGWIQLWFLGYVHPIGFAGADFTFAYRIALERYTGLHPTYYCAIVYFASFIQLFALLQHPFSHSGKTWLRIGVVLLGAFAGLMAASRATMIAYLLIVLIVIVLKVRHHPKRWLYLGLTLLLGVSLLMIPPIQNRLMEMNAQNMSAPSGQNDNGTNVRAGIVDCTISLVKQNWLWGVGPGDVQTSLNKCLNQFDTQVYAIHNYNTHNEYVNYWLSFGIIGLLVFVGVLGFSFYTAFAKKQYLHVYFLVFMCICFLTENYLDRQAGVTFFALMQTLFMAKQQSQQEIG